MITHTLFTEFLSKYFSMIVDFNQIHLPHLGSNYPDYKHNGGCIGPHFSTLGRIILSHLLSLVIAIFAHWVDFRASIRVCLLLQQLRISITKHRTVYFFLYHCQEQVRDEVLCCYTICQVLATSLDPLNLPDKERERWRSFVLHVYELGLQVVNDMPIYTALITSVTYLLSTKKE